MFQEEQTGNESGYVERAGVRVLLSTAPDEETAARLARSLVEAGLVACVNIVPRIRSIYRWEGKIEDSAESLLVIKTTDSRAAEVSELIRREHPYACPELLALGVTGGLEAYLQWVEGAST